MREGRAVWKTARPEHGWSQCTVTVPNKTPGTMPPRWHDPAAVYRLWDAEGNLLYIGSSYDPEQRCLAHQDKPWWPNVARRTEEWHPNRGRAYIEEMKAIAVERPKHNAMGTPEYRTPETDAVKRRNALASLRQRYIGESGSVRQDVYSAAREAGYTFEEARRLGTLAQIEFLDRTGLFAASVKRRREQLEMHGY